MGEVKLIETKFGREIYKELIKISIINFKKIPSNIPKDILDEIEMVNKIEQEKSNLKRKNARI